MLQRHGCPAPWQSWTKPDAGCNIQSVSAPCWRFPVITLLQLSFEQELEKPSPPQKPLPADPRSSRPLRSPSALQGQAAVQRSTSACGPAPPPGIPRPSRPDPRPYKWAVTFTAHIHFTKIKAVALIADIFVSLFFPLSRPKQPPTLPKPCIITNVKYSSWDFGQKGHRCDTCRKFALWKLWKP